MSGNSSFVVIKRFEIGEPFQYVVANDKIIENYIRLCIFLVADFRATESSFLMRKSLSYRLQLWHILLDLQHSLL